MKKGTWILISLGILTVVFMLVYKSQKPSITHEIAPVSEVYMPEDQKQVIERIKNSLGEIAEKSQRAKILYDAFNKYAVPARHMDNGGFMVVEQVKKDIGFFIHADPLPRKFEKTSALATFSCHPMPAMELKNYPGSKFTEGILLAHELSHAEDCLMRGEPESRPLSPEWLLGEFNAHRAVAIILSEYTDGKYRKIVEESSTRRAIMLREQGKKPYSFVMGNPPGDAEAIIRVFGKQDNLAMNFLLTQLTVDANITNIVGFFKNDTEAIDKVVLEFMTAFYGHYAKIMS